MRRRCFCLLSVGLASASLKPRQAAATLRGSYNDERERIDRARRSWANSSGRSQPMIVAEVAPFLGDAVLRLARHWLGTPWGRGRPQAQWPHGGKINCGTFVGTLLLHAGFNVDVVRLQRQPSSHIIATFVPHAETVRCSNIPLPRFLEKIQTQEPGLFIVGLDLHVGLIVHTGDELRFVHSNIVTGDVVDECAAESIVLSSSRYRMVGKLAAPSTLSAWLAGRRFEVQGHW